MKNKNYAAAPWSFADVDEWAGEGGVIKSKALKTPE
jgi:hypothetical protein